MPTIYNFINVTDGYNEAFRGPKSRVNFGKLLFSYTIKYEIIIYKIYKYAKIKIDFYYQILDKSKYD